MKEPLSNDALADRIKRCPSLPSMPAIAVQVLDLAQRPDVDIAEIAKTISKDPALAAKILRTVNSSFYARPQAVGTISHALVILGLQSVKTLVLGFSLVTNLAKAKAKPDGFRHLAYWKRSIYAATAARTIAAKVGVVQQEEAFLAALLMDIGMPVLDAVLGDEYGAAVGKAASHEDLLAAERVGLGFTHPEAGAVLAGVWRLPPLLAAPVAHHHDPAAVADPALRKLAELAELAGWCADVYVTEPAAGPIAAVRRLCQSLYGMAEAGADALLEAVGQQTRETASLFEINIGTPDEYEAILKRANEALVEMTLQSQAQASAAVEQSATLVAQNEQLRVKAETDALTGLANRARFDQYLTEKFAAAAAAGRPLALLLLDVDKFKSINDRHGHPTGDKVLAALGKLLPAAVRAGDLAARYGGEEMVLVLPGVGRAPAAALAERVRQAVAARSVPLPSVPGGLPVTVSIGVAAFEPGGPLKSPAHLIKAADLAVYAAKGAGRNCVRVFGAPKPAAAA